MSLRIAAGSVLLAIGLMASARGDEPGREDRPVFARADGHAPSAPMTASRHEWAMMAGLSALVLVAAGLQVWAKARGGNRPASSGSMRVTGRVALTARHAIYTVSLEGRSWLVGVGPQGPPALLGEVPAGVAERGGE